MSATYDRLAELPVTIEGYALEPLEREVSSGFDRLSTVIRLHGAGQEGVGEDVTYEALDHVALQDAGAVQPLAGTHPLHGFAELVAGLDLFAAAPPVREVSRRYRRWAFESAALDLALRQADRSLAAILEREVRPVTFVVSLRLGEPPSIDVVRRRLDRYPGLRFKLDPTSSWDDRLIAALVDTRAVDTLDLKGFYEGSIVEQSADADLYRRLAEAFPHAWLEDARITPETEPVLAAHHDRLTYDAPIHAVADIEALRWEPKMVNLKPSRLGSLAELGAAYDHCAAHGIGAYGGGQFELGAGRGQIQYLAGLFHPDTPNDIAPGGYNAPDPPPGLPTSPLAPAPATTGFRWAG